MLNTTKSPATDDLEVKYSVMMKLRHTKVENGVGEKID